MKYRKLGSSGLNISEIGLGADTFGRELDEQATAEVVNYAMDKGINYIDTADVYGWGGRSEELLGKAVKGKRSKVIIATKFGIGVDKDVPQGRSRNGLGSRGYIMKAIDASLKRLDTDYIDLYQFHMPDPTTPIEETLRALDDLVRTGKVRYIGCSNFASWELCEALWISRTAGLSSFVSVEPRYNLIDRNIEAELAPFCQAYGDRRNSQGNLGTDRLFTGQRLDGTGLYYYGARYYDPTIGRFISADTVVQNPANPQSLNRYSYVFNNPLKYTDPSGLIVEFENEDYILSMLDEMAYWGMDYAADSLFGQMVEEWADRRQEWAGFALEQPGIAEALVDSDIVFTFNGAIPTPAGQAPRSALEEFGQKAFDILGRANAGVTTSIGLTLADMTGGSSLRVGPGGTLVFEGIDKNSALGQRMQGSPLTSAFTVGYTIFTTDSQINPNTLNHELGHVTQSAILGPLYLPGYGAGAVVAWGLGAAHRNLNKDFIHIYHPMETWMHRNWPRRW